MVNCDASGGGPGEELAQIEVRHNDSGYTVRWAATAELLTIIRTIKDGHATTAPYGWLLVLLLLVGRAGSGRLRFSPAATRKRAFRRPVGPH